MCGSCAGRKGTEANASPETLATLAECIRTGESFYCHESVAERDPDGLSTDRHGNRYRRLPFERWRLCRAWMTAVDALDRSRSRSAMQLGIPQAAGTDSGPLFAPDKSDI